MSWPDGVDRIVLDTVDSTNAEAMRRAKSILGPTWILGRQQSAAKGRRGRAWSMPPGNFAATLVMRLAEPPDSIALRSFVAALALYDACVEFTGRPEAFALKWPNDVLLQGGKLAGILLESVAIDAQENTLAIGIGVNLVAAPGVDDVETGAATPVALAPALGVRISAEDFLDSLAARYAHWESQFTTFGFAPVRAAWIARAARIGEVITARTGTQEMTGTFQTVDSTGALVLTTSQGQKAIAAAEIFF